MNNKMRIMSIDYVKCIACIAVVFIHSRSIVLGNYVSALSKWAVPFFFIVSGFFLTNDINGNVRSKSLRKIKHVFMLILFALAFYTVFYFVTHCLISGKSIDNIFKLDIVLGFVLTNTPFKYTHLWFLFALMYCYIFSFAIDKRIGGKWKIYYTIIILLFLSLSIEFVPPLKAFLQLDYFSVYNMFLFRALPFFLLGVAFREGILTPRFNVFALCICLMTVVI